MTSRFLNLSMAGCMTAGLLAGCATDGPATDGASVRNIVAQQIASPHPARPAATIEGATAVEIYKNYTGSYDNPRAQPAGSAFGR